MTKAGLYYLSLLRCDSAFSVIILQKPIGLIEYILILTFTFVEYSGIRLTLVQKSGIIKFKKIWCACFV